MKKASPGVMEILGFVGRRDPPVSRVVVIQPQTDDLEGGTDKASGTGGTVIAFVIVAHLRGLLKLAEFVFRGVMVFEFCDASPLMVICIPVMLGVLRSGNGICDFGLQLGVLGFGLSQCLITMFQAERMGRAIILAAIDEEFPIKPSAVPFGFEGANLRARLAA
jgi:hypothetical protein